MERKTLLAFSLTVVNFITAGFAFELPLGLGVPKPLPDAQSPFEGWFTQKLDHFDQNNNYTWSQRYFLNDRYYRQYLQQGYKNLPMFVMIGGESPASASWVQGGYWFELGAPKGALFLHLEHRFYGESRPTQDLSLQSLQFLTSYQALGDLATFVQSMKQSYRMTDANRVVVFGGSYPGNLAAWFRLKYPNIVFAAVSSSAPVQAEADFYQYYQVVADSLAYYNKNCPAAVYAAATKLVEYSKTQQGCDYITRQFSLCTPLKADSPEDIQYFFKGQAENFLFTVQYNEPGLMKPEKIDGFNIPQICAYMTNPQVQDPVVRLSQVNDVFRKGHCVGSSYRQFIQGLSQTGWNSPYVQNNYRQWQWQTCREFGYYVTSATPNSLFGQSIFLETFERICRDAYTEGFTSQQIANNVAATNNYYGGKAMTETRVVNVHGSLDPWHALGITQSKSQLQPAIYIIGTSHTADMTTSTRNDLPTLTKARQEITAYMNSWLES